VTYRSIGQRTAAEHQPEKNDENILRVIYYMDSTNWAFTRSDRLTDRSVRLVCPTGRSDDRIV